MNKVNPIKTINWKKLNEYFLLIKKNITIKKLFKKDNNRFKNFSINLNNMLFLDYSKNLIDKKIFSLLISFANECKIKENISLLFKGKYKNNTEKNYVLYPMLRDLNNKFYSKNKDTENIINYLKKIKIFCNKIIDNKWLGYTNKRIKSIVNIGIGGSDLGIKMIIESLKFYNNNKFSIYFVSNLHGENLSEILNKINLSTTLFIISSKSFSTQETLINSENAKNYFLKIVKYKKYLNNHFIIISSNENSCKIFGISDENLFRMFNWVNGRFSIWSSIGLPISLIIGFKNYIKILKGANFMDFHFKNSKIEKNIPIILSLISILYNNFFKFETELIIPYNYNMYNFGLYYQQLSMESNGKSVDRSNNFVNYETGQISFGGVGTDSQHSFFQLMHQGTKIIPCDFIIFSKPNDKYDLFKENYSMLISNCIAQSMTLSFGDDKIVKNYKKCKGNKPNNFILLNSLNPFTLGMLISMYENKIFSQGAILNICSFDQWGVEIGKKLSYEINDKILNKNNDKEYDSSTNNLIKLYNSWNK